MRDASLALPCPKRKLVTRASKMRDALEASPLLQAARNTPVPGDEGLLSPAERARIAAAAGSAMQNTDVDLDLCKATHTDLCHALTTHCDGKDAQACSRLKSLCEHGGLHLRTSACLQAGGHMCEAAAGVCKGKGDREGVCALLSTLCAAK